MPIDTSASGVATSALQAIPYSALIGGPLDACIKAQATAAMTTVDFIKAVGFKKGASGEPEVVNVTFQYVAEGQTFHLVVPLLAIVPIPYIGIDEITIDFKANIAAGSSSVSEQSTAESFAGEASGEAKVGWGPFSVKLDFKASYSSKKDSKATQESKYSVEYTMDVHVAASQADMPAGLAKVLNILEANIARMSARGSVAVTPSSVTITKATPKAPFEVRVLDGQGRGLTGAKVSVPDATGFKVEPRDASRAESGADGLLAATLEVADATKAKPGTVELAVEVAPKDVRSVLLAVTIVKE